MADPISINDAIYAGREAMAGLQAGLLDPTSATAKGALNGAADALGALERSLKLCEYESKRQRAVASQRAERAKAEAEQKAADAEARLDRKHAATLVAAVERTAAEAQAKTHFAKKGSK